MDISETLSPASDQLDAIDLANTGPRTFTVEKVSAGSAEQPVQVHLREFPRVWRPSKNMRRVLANGWGNDASAWSGKRVRLFCDPEVRFGKEVTGGVRIEAMSDIGNGLSVPVLVTRGKSATYRVEPLDETQSELNIAACESIPELREAWKHADTATKARIQARVKELEQGALDGQEG